MLPFLSNSYESYPHARGRCGHPTIIGSMTADRQDDVTRFLTVADAAEVLSVAPTDVVGLIETGELPAIRVGRPGAWRIERVELEAYIEAMYEETRRRAQWEQSDLAAIPELSGGRVIWPDGH